jgi:hypothetical protein
VTAPPLFSHSQRSLLSFNLPIIVLSMICRSSCHGKSRSSNYSVLRHVRLVKTAVQHPALKARGYLGLGTAPCFNKCEVA